MAKMNRYERGTNKRAVARKERAKAKSFREDENLGSSIQPINERSNEYEGRIVGLRGATYDVLWESRIYFCQLESKLSSYVSSHSGTLVVGDYVSFTPITSEVGIIYSRQARTSFLARLRGNSDRFSPFQMEQQVIASNIDTAVIVASVTCPKFHSSLVDRYLILCKVGHITPVICLSKVDLTDDRDSVLDWYKNYLGIVVLETSISTGIGINDLHETLKGKTSVLVGNSGVGKSSLIKTFVTAANIRTQSISLKHQQGRHTTTNTSMYQWEQNSYIIDTPGIRNLVVTNLSRRVLKDFFPEFRPYEAQCQFTDCIHLNEPNCAVRDATERGFIPMSRYQGYLLLLKESV